MRLQPGPLVLAQITTPHAQLNDQETVIVPRSVGRALVPAGRELATRIGIRAVLTRGCLIAALGCGFFAVFHGALWQAFVMTGVLGVGLGTTFAAIPGLIVQAIPARETGSAMGFYQVVRFTGFSLGSALAASILAAQVSGNGQPTAGGYTMVLWISAGFCVLAAALAWFLPPDPPGSRPRNTCPPTRSDYGNRPTATTSRRRQPPDLTTRARTSSTIHGRVLKLHERPNRPKDASSPRIRPARARIPELTSTEV